MITAGELRMKTTHRPEELAALLVRRRKAIQSSWSALLLELPDSHYQGRSAEELAAWTGQGIEAIIESLNTGSSQPVEAHAGRVSMVRARLGFGIQEVVQGLLLLKEAALGEIVEAYPDDPDRIREATLALDQGLRTMIASFADHFAGLMQQSVSNEQERTHLLLEVAEAAGSSLDLPLVLSVVADSVRRAAGGSHCTLFLRDESKEALSPQAWAGHIESEELRIAVEQVLAPEADPLIARALTTHEPVTHLYSGSDRLLGADLCKGSGVAGAVALPILLADRLLAVALVLLEDPLGGSEEDQIRLARGIANAVAPAVENAQRYAEAREQLAESHRLEEVTASFLDVHSLREVLDLVCREIRRLTEAAGASVFLPDQGGEFHCAFRSGADAGGDSQRPQQTHALRLRLKEHDLGQILLTGLPRGLDDEEARFLERFAHHAAASIEHASYHEQKEKLAALEERQKLAHELHDSVTQSLYGVTMYAEAAARLLEAGDPSKAGRLLRQMRDTSLKALRETRLLVFGLRPPLLAEQGLVATLQARLAAVEGRAGVQTQFTAEGVESLPHKLAEGLYGICSEALNNSLKHANASRISVRLSGTGSEVSLEVLDDGQGFDPVGARGTGGMGLVGMQERATRLGAQLRVTSRVGEGTRVRVDAPLEVPPGQPRRPDGETR